MPESAIYYLGQYQVSILCNRGRSPSVKRRAAFSFVLYTRRKEEQESTKRGMLLLARLLRTAGYSTNQVGSYLKNVLNKSALQAMSILNRAGYGYAQIANFILAY